MGLFDMFGGKRASKVDKLVKKVTNAYLQPTERQRFMHVLAEMGTDEALFGLMKRFTYRTEVTIVDEDEKRLACELLVDAGATAIPTIERFVSQEEAVYWPLKALKDLAGLDVAVALALRALDRAGGKDARVNEQRVQLVSNLRDFHHGDVQARLVDLCTDHDEDVRIMAVDGLLTYGVDASLEHVVARILDEDESLRVKTVIYEQLLELEWSLTPWRAEIELAEILPKHYRIGGGGLLKRV